MMKGDYYSVLGIDQSADDQQIRDAYYRIAAETLLIEDTREFIYRFQALNEALVVLISEESRADYDESILREKESEIDVELDTAAENEFKVKVVSCSALLVEPGEVRIVGELASVSGKRISEYREIHVAAYDENQQILGTSYRNWSSFGRNRIFEVLLNYKPKRSTPKRILVYPSD